MALSLNKAELIGNITRDIEIRYTQNGTPIANFSIATNRSWVEKTGEKKEEVEYHRIVAWNKLAELCQQLLSKGAKVYVHGRLATRKWTDKEGLEKQTTEIVIDDMILLGASKPKDPQVTDEDISKIPL